MEETTDNTTDYYSHTLVGIQLGAETVIQPNLSAYIDGRFEHRAYDDDFPLFLEERADNQLDISTGLNYAIQQNLIFQPSVSYRNADSNIGFYDYDRWVSSVSLKHKF